MEIEEDFLQNSEIPESEIPSAVAPSPPPIPPLPPPVVISEPLPSIRNGLNAPGRPENIVSNPVNVAPQPTTLSTLNPTTSTANEQVASIGTSNPMLLLVLILPVLVIMGILVYHRRTRRRSADANIDNIFKSPEAKFLAQQLGNDSLFQGPDTYKQSQHSRISYGHNYTQKPPMTKKVSFAASLTSIKSNNDLRLYTTSIPNHNPKAPNIPPPPRSKPPMYEPTSYRTPIPPPRSHTRRNQRKSTMRSKMFTKSKEALLSELQSIKEESPVKSRYLPPNTSLMLENRMGETNDNAATIKIKPTPRKFDVERSLQPVPFMKNKSIISSRRYSTVSHASSRGKLLRKNDYDTNTVESIDVALKEHLRMLSKDETVSPSDQYARNLQRRPDSTLGNVWLNKLPSDFYTPPGSPHQAALTRF
ncbi:hypothetical protein MP638_003410 [Amoeboaphelidium occidentale]|nr:hypothetical protein MP638_003410 [Amoeboaphelidium occidentale]